MKTLFAWPAVVVCLLLLVAPSAQAALMSDSDLWEDAAVDAHSGTLGAWPIQGIFDYGPYTMFRDSQPQGTTHWVEWHTAAAVTIESINLVGCHDGAPYNINQRGFSAFRLFYKVNSGDPWTLLHNLPDTDTDGNLRYDGGPSYPAANILEYCAAVPSTTAQYWRAEFDQYGPPSSASGPRVNELDGYDYIIPEPATMCLVGAGLVLLLTRRRK